MDAFASMPHYLDHIAPVWRLLGDAAGTFYAARGLLPHATALRLSVAPAHAGSGPMIVAGYRDMFRARRLGYGPFVMMQHGAGQSYGGDPRSARNQAYAGGKDNDDVALFLVPGPHPAARWREAYPDARVVEVGNVKPLPALEARPGDGKHVVAVTFHWPCGLIPETGTAWRTFRDTLPFLDERWEVIGTGHPRWFADTLAPWYHAHGIEPVASLEEVARRADVLVGDNTSAIFEFAAGDRPIVILNSPAYRRGVAHGLRFWDAATLGVQVDRPDGLIGAVRLALLDPPGLRAERARVLAMVYAGGGAPAAAEAIRAL